MNTLVRHGARWGNLIKSSMHNKHIVGNDLKTIHYASYKHSAKEYVEATATFVILVSVIVGFLFVTSQAIA